LFESKISPDSLFYFISRNDVGCIFWCSDKEGEGDSWFQITHPHILLPVKKQKKHFPHGTEDTGKSMMTSPAGGRETRERIEGQRYGTGQKMGNYNCPKNL
jgi:hypothetical protein